MRRCFRKFLQERPNTTSEKSNTEQHLGPARLTKLGEKNNLGKTVYFLLGIQKLETRFPACTYGVLGMVVAVSSELPWLVGQGVRSYITRPASTFL